MFVRKIGINIPIVPHIFFNSKHSTKHKYLFNKIGMNLIFKWLFNYFCINLLHQHLFQNGSFRSRLVVSDQ